MAEQLLADPVTMTWMCHSLAERARTLKGEVVNVSFVLAKQEVSVSKMPQVAQN